MDGWIEGWTTAQANGGVRLREKNGLNDGK